MYETEKQRIVTLIQERTGITRTWNADLAREADERAFEGYLEVGTGPMGFNADGTPIFKGISHPPRLERESRLGPQWAGKGVAEVAVWGYQIVDVSTYVVNSWMTSAAHRAVITDPVYKHIGIGIFSILPVGEIHRRWYAIAWLSVSVPTVVTPEVNDMILVPIELYPAGTKAYFNSGIQYSLYKVVDGALQRRTFIPTSTTWAHTGARTALNGDTTKAGYYIMDGAHAGWVVSGWTPPASVVKPPVIVDKTAEVQSLSNQVNSLTQTVTNLTSTVSDLTDDLESTSEYNSALESVNDTLNARITRKNVLADELKAV